MGRNFLELKQFLENRYPELRDNIYGANYPPPYYKRLIASIASWTFIIGLAVLFAGDNIFGTLGVIPPEIYYTIKANKGLSFFALFMINTYGANMLSTGAFEISLDGDVIFSKLEQGRMPTIDEVVHILHGKGLHVAQY